MTSTLKSLQKEFKAFKCDGRPKSAMIFVVDVYSDRLIVGGYNNDFVEQFFERRGVACTVDRGGWSINASDAQKLGINLAVGSYSFQYADCRKKP